MLLPAERSSSTHGTYAVPWVTGLVVLIVMAIHFTVGPAAESLVYDRTAIAQGEWWRLVSGHFVHCDLQHLVWNLAAMATLGCLLEQRIGFRLVRVVLVSCMGVSSWLWLLKSSLHLYCGLSGMLNGLLAVLLAVLWKEFRHPLVPLVGLGSIIKIMVESTSHQSLFTNLSWAAVPGAHGAGFAAGLLFLCWGAWIQPSKAIT